MLLFMDFYNCTQAFVDKKLLDSSTVNYIIVVLYFIDYFNMFTLPCIYKLNCMNHLYDQQNINLI